MRKNILKVKVGSAKVEGNRNSRQAKENISGERHEKTKDKDGVV
jgi:hypothetical protein